MHTNGDNCITTTNAREHGYLLLGDLSHEQSKVVEDIRNTGGKVFFIKINFQDGTPAKSLKVMLIENKLSKVGEIVKLWPPVDEIEDDSYSFTLYIVLCTHEEKDTVNRHVRVDCVERVFVKQI